MSGRQTHVEVPPKRDGGEQQNGQAQMERFFMGEKNYDRTEDFINRRGDVIES
jgi:hypothetical protein